MNKRIRKIIGYILIILGIALPLFAFTKLTVNSFMSRSRYVNYKEEFQKVEEDTIKKREEEIKKYSDKIKKQSEKAIIDPFSANDYRSNYELETIGQDEIFAYMIIPKIDVIKPIYLDASYDHLDKGFAQIEGTGLPVGGRGTRCVIAGHRGWYGDTFLLHADELESGDEIFIDRGSEVLTYYVTDKEIIDANDWKSLEPREDEDMLTLLTCHPPIPPFPDRLLVNAVRRSDEIKEDFIEESSEKTDENPSGKITFKKIDLDGLISSTKVSNKTLITNIVIYTFTLIGYIALFFTIYKFIRFLKKEKRGAKQLKR